MIVLNITIASHGLRPARDLRALSARRHTASRRARKSSHGTTPSIFKSGSFLASRPEYRSPRSKKTHLTHQPRLPLSTNRQPDSKSTTPEKGEFLEVPSNKINAVIPNVWLGTSVENEDVIRRLDDLRRVPSAIRFISFEPLIGPVGQVDLAGIHWAIVGGESGREARPIQEKWVDEIHVQCVRHRTAFFFKQWGTWGKDNKRRSKKANGREYRGKNWDEMPAASY